jgi:hypothetical protein
MEKYAVDRGISIKEAATLAIEHAKQNGTGTVAVDCSGSLVFMATQWSSVRELVNIYKEEMALENRRAGERRSSLRWDLNRVFVLVERRSGRDRRRNSQVQPCAA